MMRWVRLSSDVVSAILWKGADIGIKESASAKFQVWNWPNAQENTKVLSDTYKELVIAGTVTELVVPPMYANYNPVGVVEKEIPHLNKTKYRPILDGSRFAIDTLKRPFSLDWTARLKALLQPNYFLFYADMSAFNLIPARPSSRNCLCCRLSDGKHFQNNYLPFGFQNCPVLFDVVSRATLKINKRQVRDGVILRQYPSLINSSSVQFTVAEIRYLQENLDRFISERKWHISIYFDDVFGAAETELFGRYILASILVFWTRYSLRRGEGVLTSSKYDSTGSRNWHPYHDCSPSPRKDCSLHPPHPRGCSHTPIG